MKKKTALFFCLLGNLFVMTAQEVMIPRPKKDLLYTEYISKKTSPYIKKPIEGKGIIAMDGKERFLFLQSTPTKLKIIKNQEEMVLIIGNNPPMKLQNFDENQESNVMSLLFTEDPKEINQIFSVTKQKRGETEEFYLTPKKGRKELQLIDWIRFVGIGDRLENLDIKYKNGTLLQFDFLHTVTGEKPDPTLFSSS